VVNFNTDFCSISASFGCFWQILVPLMCPSFYLCSLPTSLG